MLVVFAGVQEFAVVAEAAETGLFVVFADVGGEVGGCYGTDVGGGFDGTDGFGGAVRVRGKEGFVSGCAFVCVVVIVCGL